MNDNKICNECGYLAPMGNILVTYRQKFLNLCDEILSQDPTDPNGIEFFQRLVAFDKDEELKRK